MMSQLSQLLVFIKYMHGDTNNNSWFGVLFGNFRGHWHFQNGEVSWPRKRLLKQSHYSVDREYTLMPSKTYGFTALVKSEALPVTVTPSCVHQNALMCKTLPLIPRESLSTVVKVSYCFTKAKFWIIDCARGFVTKKIYCWESCQIQESQDFK